MIVLDASAGFALMANEPAEAAVARAVAGQDVVVPDLFDVEVTATLRKRVLRGDVDRTLVRRFMLKLVTFPAERVPSRLLAVDAMRHLDNLTIYDAMYVTLADYLNAPLVTTDKRLAQAPLPPGVTVVVAS